MTELELFVLARGREDCNEGRMSLQMFEALHDLVLAYGLAVEQSRPSQPDKQTMWGKEARFGFYVTLKRLAEVWKKHPDWREDW